MKREMDVGNMEANVYSEDIIKVLELHLKLEVLYNSKHLQSTCPQSSR